MYSIAKKFGATTAQGMRGIVLLDSPGKLYHGILHRKLIQAVSPLSTQFGGFRGQQTLSLSAARTCLWHWHHLSFQIEGHIRGGEYGCCRIDCRDHTACLALLECCLSWIGSCHSRRTSKHMVPIFATQLLRSYSRITAARHISTATILVDAKAACRRVFTTTRGSRPGSPLADIAFNILMRSLFADTTAIINEHDLISGVWDCLHLPSPVVAWMDDVAFPISVTSASNLDASLESLSPRFIRCSLRMAFV